MRFLLTSPHLEVIREIEDNMYTFAKAMCPLKKIFTVALLFLPCPDFLSSFIVVVQ